MNRLFRIFLSISTFQSDLSGWKLEAPTKKPPSNLAHSHISSPRRSFVRLASSSKLRQQTHFIHFLLRQEFSMWRLERFAWQLKKPANRRQDHLPHLAPLRGPLDFMYNSRQLKLTGARSVHSTCAA